MDNGYNALFSCLWEAIMAVTILVSVGSYFSEYYLFYFVFFSVATISLLEWYHYETYQKCKAREVREESSVITMEEKILEKDHHKKIKHHQNKRWNKLRHGKHNTSTSHAGGKNGDNNGLKSSTNSVQTSCQELGTINETVDTTSTLQLSNRTNKTMHEFVTLRSKIKSKIDIAREKHARRSLPPDIMMTKHSQKLNGV